MGGGGGDALQGGQTLAHKLGHLLQGAAGDDDRQVKRAGHQIDALHLVILVDALGHPVEALVALGGYLYLDEGRDRLLLGAVPVYNGLVAQDDLFLFVPLDCRLYVLQRHIGHGCQLLLGVGAVLLQELEQFVVVGHTAFLPSRDALRPWDGGPFPQNVVSQILYTLWGQSASGQMKIQPSICKLWGIARQNRPLTFILFNVILILLKSKSNREV